MKSAKKSKRQILLKYGFNQRHLSFLIEKRYLKNFGSEKRIKLCENQISELEEGFHYVACKECGAYQSQITEKHLKTCSGLSLKDYKEKYPKEKVLCFLCAENKKKTEDQKKAQSEKLKKRFQTPEGKITRKIISQNAKRVMEGGYREEAASHLKKITKRRQLNGDLSKTLKKRWTSGSLRKKQESWRNQNKEFVKNSAFNARGHISKKYTKIHKKLKEAMLDHGISNFQTELEIGYYHLDEGCMELKLCIEVDGCYWHGCEVCGFEPKLGTVITDRRKETFLKNKGWKILRLKGHEIRTDRGSCIDKIRRFINDS